MSPSNIVGVDPHRRSFTAALLAEVRADPGREITQLLRSVRRRVHEATGGRQVPWVNEALLSDVSLGPRGRVGDPRGRADEDQRPRPRPRRRRAHAGPRSVRELHAAAPRPN